MVRDLKGKRVALGSRASMQAGLLPYYFLQQLGLDPANDLAVCSFYDERRSDARSDERDVMERVRQHEYDAGAVSGRTIGPIVPSHDPDVPGRHPAVRHDRVA